MQKNENRSLFATLHKTQLQVNQRPQHKTRYTEFNRREIGKEPQTHGNGGKFLKQNIRAQTLRSRLDEWDLMLLKSFFKAKNIANRKNQQLYNGKNILLQHIRQRANIQNK